MVHPSGLSVIPSRTTLPELISALRAGFGLQSESRPYRSHGDEVPALDDSSSAWITCRVTWIPARYLPGWRLKTMTRNRKAVLAIVPVEIRCWTIDLHGFAHKMYFAIMSGIPQPEETKRALIPLMEPMKDQDKLLNKVWRRIFRQGKSVGQQTAYAVLLMYFAFRRKGTPLYARSIILGALGYFLALFDAIPDLSPVVGYTDDLGVLSFGLVTIAAYINDDVRIKARRALARLFAVDLELLRPIDEKL